MNIRKHEKPERLKKMANAVRCDILRMTLKAGKQGGHIGGAFSCAEILAVLYGAVMNVTPENAEAQERDRFILSKGHSAVALYSALYENGFLTEDELNTFEKDGSLFQTHCIENHKCGIEISSGSLGVGLSVGVGMALAGQRENAGYRVFVLLGNGECNEGCIWEAGMLAGQLGLDHLIAIVDNNQMQLDGESSNIIALNQLDCMFSAMGWNVIQTDGHDVAGLVQAFSRILQNGKPTVIIADTIKGKGCSLTEKKAEFHHAVISQEQYNDAMKELQND
ncbi:transketolase [bacterium 1XD42-1]|nr:transketolase [bacterium 1XD42-8]RKJ64612.1 transketolase [bacterium 1XD42-1]